MQQYNNFKGINLKKHSDNNYNQLQSLYKYIVIGVLVTSHYIHTKMQLQLTEQKYTIELQHVLQQLEETQQRLK